MLWRAAAEAEVFVQLLVTIDLLDKKACEVEIACASPLPAFPARSAPPASHLALRAACARA
eukprot:426279-Rhodomonas_salina.1